MPDPSLLEHLFSAGPYGLCVLLLLGLVYLYRKLEASQEKRVETAGKSEVALAGVQAAIEALARTVKQSEDQNDERFEVLKEISRQQVLIAQLVGTNGAALGKIETELLRELIARAGR